MQPYFGVISEFQALCVYVSVHVCVCVCMCVVCVCTCVCVRACIPGGGVSRTLQFLYYFNNSSLFSGTPSKDILREKMSSI